MRMRPANQMEKRSEGRKLAKEVDDLNSSLTLQEKGFSPGCNNDELIVFGDHDNEQDESSLLNSNLLKMLDDEKTPNPPPRYGNSYKSPISKKGTLERSNFLPPKPENRAEPIKVFRNTRETATLKDLAGSSVMDHRLEADLAHAAKTTTDVPNTKRKSKLSRQTSKESFTSKKSGRSIRSRKQSKDSAMLNEPPLKKTLASVMGKMSTSNLDKPSPPSMMMNPLENSPNFINKTVKELKLLDKNSPMSLKPGFIQQSMFHQSRHHLMSSPQTGSFHLALEKVELTDRNEETNKRIAHLMNILKSKPEHNTKELVENEFDSERLTHDTPTSKHLDFHHPTHKMDILQSEETSVNISHLAKSRIIHSNEKGETTPTKSRTPRIESYKPFTLSQVLTKKNPENKN